MLAHRATKHVVLQIASTCYSGCCIKWQLRNQIWSSSKKQTLFLSATLQPSYRPCVVTPFPVRLACLANLPQCLHVNLTSWQAHWSASKMTWLARGSVLLFGSWHPQVPFKWVTTAWFCKRRPNEAAQCVYRAGIEVRVSITGEISPLSSRGTLHECILAWIALGISTLNNLRNHHGDWFGMAHFP